MLTHDRTWPRAASLLWLTGVIAACGGSVVVDGQGGSSPTTDACAHESDAVVFQEPDLAQALGGCVATSQGNGSAAVLCFADEWAVNLSSGCLSCLDAYMECAARSCLAACTATDGGETACDACEAAACGSAFSTCSGQPPPT